MDFKCKELTISDNPEFGCTIEFSDTQEKGYEGNQTVEEILSHQGKYFLMQRSYPEDFDEIDFYSVETSESNVGLSSRDKILIELAKDEIILQWSGEKIVIGLKLKEIEYQQLQKILKKRFKDRIIML